MVGRAMAASACDAVDEPHTAATAPSASKPSASSLAAAAVAGAAAAAGAAAVAGATALTVAPSLGAAYSLDPADDLVLGLNRIDSAATDMSDTSETGSQISSV